MNVCFVHQNQDCRDCSTALTHRLSLPTTYEEMDVWQFQSSVPCKIRAKRGCATHPRSIAERVYIHTSVSIVLYLDTLHSLAGLLIPFICKFLDEKNAD